MPRRPALPSRRAPRQERAQATCDAILTATARILVREGYPAVSTNRVAREAGVSIGSLYQYYPDKEGLLLAVMERHRTEWLHAFSAGLETLEGQPLPIAVRALVRRVFELKAANPGLHQVLYELAPRLRQLGEGDEYKQRLCRLVRGFLAPRVGQIRPRNLEMAVFVIVHTVEVLCYAAGVDRPDYLTSRAYTDEVCALLLGYLRPESATRRPRRLASEGRRSGAPAQARLG